MANYIFTCCSIILLVSVCSSQQNSKLSQHTAKNHEMLSKLGLSRVRGPNSHHRKRLAIESRHHSRSDDSHMFIVKLPPNPYYYVHTRPNNLPSESTRKIPVGFKSNGKPAKIYHWNIPVLKKFTAHKSKSRGTDTDRFDVIDSKMWNEVLDKPGKIMNIRRSSYKPSYYVPAKPKKASFMKYFPGNGKPKSFYIIEKSKKAHYHRLLP